jgi:predicted CoA-substrate-specific enzyme activase
MITCGIDVGSSSAEAVLMDGDRLLGYSIIPTSHDSAATSQEALLEALAKTDLQAEEVSFTVATGYGRVIVPFADRQVSEISCHAKGGHHLLPSVRTILDMGGQDCKVIRCDGRGKVVTFLMNDKCAAGTGRAMEVISSLLQVRLEDVGGLSLRFAGEPRKISNTCVVFAKSEVLALTREGVSLEEILASLCDGVAERVKALIRRVGLEEAFAISGGIAKNQGVVKRLEEKLGVRACAFEEPQIVGAVGAALFAREFCLKSGRV